MAEPAQGTSQNGDQQRQLKGTIIERDGVKFEAIESDELSSVPVLSQALDNQWLPRNLLKEALKIGEVTAELERQREEIVRAEYIRSLINGDQVVINRAYLFNNPIIFRDYLPAKKGSNSDEVRKAVDNREAFKKLLRDKVVVPYLFKEKSPVQQLNFSTLSFEEWKKVCTEVPGMQCVRLSWNEEQNNKSTDIDVAGRFVNSALTIGTPQKDFEKYIEDLDLEDHDKDELKKQLRTVIQKAVDLLNQNETVTREDLYKAFVTIDGTKPADRHYDRTKPFAGEIKELLDLAYARNLPDALGGYLLTPIDSLPRSALQEAADELRSSDTTAQDITKMLQRKLFEFVQEGRYLPSLDLLSLPDVHQIRGMSEWNDYNEQFKKLLADPIPAFAEGQAYKVQDSYARLADQMTKLIADRYAQDLTKAATRTVFVIELVIEIGAGLISVAGIPGGPIIQVVGGSAIALAGKKALSFSVRFVIRDIASKRANKGLSNSIELMRGKMRDATQQWDELLRLVRETRAFRESEISPDKAPNLTPPEPIA